MWLSVVVVGLARHVHGARGGVVLVRFAQGQNRRVSVLLRAVCGLVLHRLDDSTGRTGRDRKPLL